ncbi:MAG: peptide ABC transporter substrate-binding protein [Pseudomonadota bacterium]|nr:peptide ABC transporter substrate-binding protein [Pseudomonadota bacterium]
MTSLMRRLAAAAGLAAMMALPAAAETVFHRGNSADPETLDQHKTSTVYEAHILQDLYEGLVTYDAGARVIPGVAESWTLSPDGRVYTFRLRGNAKWSNGDPVRAGDFVFSFRRILTPATAAKYANVLYPIKNGRAVNKGEMKPEALGVRAPDERTVEITLEAPTPYFLELLTHQTGFPVHPPSVEKHGADFVKPGNMVSNGAYTLAEFRPNAHVKLVKNPNFHDAANVRIDTVYFYPTEDRSAALRRFQAGELHVNDDVPTEQAKFIRQTLGKQFRLTPSLGSYYYTVNTGKKPFDDVRVRLALSLAIDREFLAEEIWAGTMLPAYSLVPPGTGNYGEPAYVDWRKQSQLDREDRAKQLLREAGFGPGKPLRLEMRYNTSENHKNTALAVADMWKPLGIEISFVNTDTATHYAVLRDKGDYDVARAGWIADYNDPQNFLFLLESDNKGLNYANYINPDYDALMKKAGSETDLEKRAEILRQAETIVMRDQPYIPLLYYGSKNLVSPKVEGWEDNIRDVHPTRFLNIRP